MVSRWTLPLEHWEQNEQFYCLSYWILRWLDSKIDIMHPKRGYIIYAFISCTLFVKVSKVNAQRSQHVMLANCQYDIVCQHLTKLCIWTQIFNIKVLQINWLAIVDWIALHIKSGVKKSYDNKRRLHSIYWIHHLQAETKWVTLMNCDLWWILMCKWVSKRKENISTVVTPESISNFRRYHLDSHNSNLAPHIPLGFA